MTSTTAQILKSQNHFHLCPIGTAPEAQMYLPRNTGRYGRLSSAASHERRVLRLRSVGQAGPDPARVKRPGEGNVSHVECAASEWEYSTIYAVASGFR